jgi:hypothetical protein
VLWILKYPKDEKIAQFYNVPPSQSGAYILTLNGRTSLENLLSSVGVFSPDYGLKCERTDIVSHLLLMVSDLMTTSVELLWGACQQL